MQNEMCYDGGWSSFLLLASAISLAYSNKRE